MFRDPCFISRNEKGIRDFRGRCIGCTVTIGVAQAPLGDGPNTSCKRILCLMQISQSSTPFLNHHQGILRPASRLCQMPTPSTVVEPTGATIVIQAQQLAQVKIPTLPANLPKRSSNCLVATRCDYNATTVSFTLLMGIIDFCVRLTKSALSGIYMSRGLAMGFNGLPTTSLSNADGQILPGNAPDGTTLPVKRFLTGRIYTSHRRSSLDWWATCLKETGVATEGGAGLTNGLSLTRSRTVLDVDDEGFKLWLWP